MLALAMLVACGGHETGAEQDAGPDGGGSGGGGLRVRWKSSPESLPNTIEDGLTLERATFAIDSLRIVGDVAAGDPRTTRGAFQIQWDEGVAPAPVEFPDAPGGLYSQLSLLIDGHVSMPSIELRGHVQLEGTDYEYRIRDDGAFSETFEIDALLTPPEMSEVTLVFDLAHVVDELDFSQFENNSGRLELETGNPEIATLRTKLSESITVGD